MARENRYVACLKVLHGCPRKGNPKESEIGLWIGLTRPRKIPRRNKNRKVYFMAIEIQTVQITLGTGNEILVILFVWALQRKWKLRFRKKK